jgi:nucleoside phosphorylase
MREYWRLLYPITPREKEIKMTNKSDEQLIELFSNQGLSKQNLGDLIDQDKLSANDFFYFKQGYELGVESLQQKNAILVEALEKIIPYTRDYRDICNEEKAELIQGLIDSAEAALEKIKEIE